MKIKKVILEVEGTRRTESLLGDLSSIGKGSYSDLVPLNTNFRYTVDLDTLECKGEALTNDPVLVDPDFWAEHCSKVAQRVKMMVDSID